MDDPIDKIERERETERQNVNFYDQNSSPKFTTNTELGNCICEKLSPNFMTKLLSKI
jgi:hypothetical protein